MLQVFGELFATSSFPCGRSHKGERDEDLHLEECGVCRADNKLAKRRQTGDVSEQMLVGSAQGSFASLAATGVGCCWRTPAPFSRQWLRDASMNPPSTGPIQHGLCPVNEEGYSVPAP